MPSIIDKFLEGGEIRRKREERKEDLELRRQASKRANSLSEINNKDAEIRHQKDKTQRFFGGVNELKLLSDQGDWDGVRRVTQNIAQIDPRFVEGSEMIYNQLEWGHFDDAKQSINNSYQLGLDNGLIKRQAAAKRAPKQKGEGGLVFDPNTGTYSIDELAKNRFDELNAKKQAGGSFSFKDRQGLNKDITSITKEAVKIKTAASELIGLKKRGTAASKLGAVFKFMKSLDPTSVVRETEQGQVYAAAGAGAQLAGMLNGILGQGKLTDKGFNDLVSTAKNIANSNLSSTQITVDNLLGTFEDTLTTKFKDLIKLRVPKPFEIDKSKNITVDY